MSVLTITLAFRRRTSEIIFAVFGPLLGYIADKISLSVAMFSAAFLFGLPTFLILRNKNVRIEQKNRDLM